MDSWKKLNLFQKTIFSLVILIAIIVMPELAFLVDIGGMELLFGFMVLYFQSFAMWFSAKWRVLKESISLAITSFLSSPLCSLRVYALQAAFCVGAFLFTGSLALSTLFFMPGMFISGPLV